MGGSQKPPITKKEPVMAVKCFIQVHGEKFAVCIPEQGAQVVSTVDDGLAILKERLCRDDDSQQEIMDNIAILQKERDHLHSKLDGLLDTMETAFPEMSNEDLQVYIARMAEFLVNLHAAVVQIRSLKKTLSDVASPIEPEAVDTLGRLMNLGKEKPHPFVERWGNVKYAGIEYRRDLDGDGVLDPQFGWGWWTYPLPEMGWKDEPQGD
jgi:hypothetical protein